MILEVVPKLLSIVFLLFGSTMAVAGVIAIFRRRFFLRKALVTNGVVTNVKVRHSSASQGSTRMTHYYPTVRFQIADGRVGDCRASTSFGQHYAVGQPVTVHYDPQNPCKFTLGDAGSLAWMTLFLFAFVGGIFAIIGLVTTLVNFL